MRKSLILFALIVASVVASAQAASYIPKPVLGYCYSAALAGWTPIGVAAAGTVATYIPPGYSVYGMNGTSAYPLQCDSSGNLTLANAFQTIVVSGIPAIIAPNGTIATSGVVTFGTAMPVIYPYAWFRFPAAAVSGGSAGFYYATCTSTTVCQVYTSFVDPTTTDFSPFIPTSPVAATGSNASYTQTTASDIVILRKTIAGGTMGPNGSLRKTAWIMVPNNANAKTAKVGFSGGYLVSQSQAAILNNRFQLQIQNAGDQTHQNAFPTLAGFAFSNGVQALGTTDTTASQQWILSCNIATATDYCGVIQNQDEFLYRP